MRIEQRQKSVSDGRMFLYHTCALSCSSTPSALSSDSMCVNVFGKVSTSLQIKSITLIWIPFEGAKVD